MSKTLAVPARPWRRARLKLPYRGKFRGMVTAFRERVPEGISGAVTGSGHFLSRADGHVKRKFHPFHLSSTHHVEDNSNGGCGGGYKC